MRSSFAVLLLTLGCGMVALGGLARAQQPDPPDLANPPLITPPGADGSADGEAGETRDKPPEIREQTIYVPYTRLKSVFEKDGRGVFLPYEQFQQLWKQARGNLVPETDVQPPVKAFITEVNSVATVETDVVRVRATVSIELLTAGWHEVSLRLADAAILSARFGDQPARVLSRPDAGYFLLLEKKGDQPESRQLQLEYAKAISKSPGQNQVAFQAPQAPVNRWEFRIAEPGVKVNIHPLIAASQPLDEDQQPAAKPKVEPAAEPANGGAAKEEGEAGGEEGAKKEEEAKGEEEAKEEEGDQGPAADEKADDAGPEDEEKTGNQGPEEEQAKSGNGAKGGGEEGEGDAVEQVKPEPGTRIQAFVGAAPTVQFNWTPRAEGATGLAALASVQTQQQVTIDEGVVNTTTQLVYEISRAEVSQLRIEVPLDQKVTGVFDPNVRQWEVQREDDAQRITVQLFEPTKGTQRLVVEMERFSADLAERPVEVPIVRALDVARQQGVVVVGVTSVLRGEVTQQTGLQQLDATELPDGTDAARFPFAYRYATLPFQLTLRVEKVQPRISTRELVEVYLEPQQLSMELLALLTIERAGVFQLELDIPANFEVRRVEGKAVAGAEAPVVDSHHLLGEDKTRLQINLGRKAIGRVGLWIELHRRLDDPNLLTPTGKSSTIELVPPRVVPAGLEQITGSLLIYAPESLQATSADEAGLRGISFEEALEGTESMRGQRYGSLRPILSFASSREPARLQLKVERRQPQVTVRQLLEARIEAGVVQYGATFFYDVRYSGLPSVRIDVPEALATSIRNDSSTMRKSPIEPPPEDVAEGYVAWSFARDTELLGEFELKLSWEKKIDELAVGESMTLTLPKLEPQDVDRAWGQILLAKAENLDLRPDEEPKGLRPIDPQVDLMPGADGGSAAQAFEFHDDWTLAVRVTRYKLEEVKRTSVERSLVRSVVTRKVANRPQQTLVQALFRVRSVRQRLAITLPPDVEFDASPLRINGQVVNLERGDQDEFYIPLAGRNLDEPLLLELRYTAPGSYRELAVPSFPDEPALQKVYLCAYVPDELAVVASEGPWTSELILQLREMLAGIPAVRHSDDQLLDWVSEGFDISGSPDFPTEGNLHVYSALRPPPDGSLRLTAMRRVVLNGMLLVAVLGLGLLLLARPLGERLVFLVLILAGVVSSAVFTPTLAVQLLNGTLLAAVLLVVVLWLVVSLARWIPRLASNLAGAQLALATAGPGGDAAIPTATAVGSPPESPAAPDPVAADDRSIDQSDSQVGQSPFAGPRSADESGNEPPPADQDGGASHV